MKRSDIEVAERTPGGFIAVDALGVHLAIALKMKDGNRVVPLCKNVGCGTVATWVKYTNAGYDDMDCYCSRHLPSNVGAEYRGFREVGLARVTHAAEGEFPL